MCAFHLEFVELYILLQSTNEYCCKSHFIIGPSLLLAVSYLCLIVKLLNQEVVGACTKAHVLNHPASTFSCILMSVVGTPLPSAGPNAVCGSVHIIMHLQPNTSCPPSPAQPSPAAAAVKFNDRRRVTRTALHRWHHHHQPRSNQFDGSGMKDSYLYL